MSGGAFSYIMVTFGELAAVTALAGLLLEYVLGMAAVARGFSNYLARLLNLNPASFVVDVADGYSFDFAAAGIIMLMSILLSLGVRESALFISGELSRLAGRLAGWAGGGAGGRADGQAGVLATRL